MITFISGVPGSGKTYLAITEMRKEKKLIHTNIEIKKEIKFEKFIWKEFYNKINQLYAIKENSELCIELSKTLEIFDIAIYYDECHLELASQDKIVIWWLSWHRHLSQTIFLITQSKGTLAQKYRAYPEIFVDAHPATKRIFGSVMRYTEYASYKMSKDDVIRKFSIKIDAKIFELYRTGAVNKGTNTLRFKLYTVIGFILVPIFMFYYILTMNDTEPVIEENNNTIASVSIAPKVVAVKSPIVCDISGKWFHYAGWTFHHTHPLVKEILSKPKKTHSITSYYHKFQYSQKYAHLFEMLVSNKSSSFQ